MKRFKTTNRWFLIAAAATLAFHALAAGGFALDRSLEKKFFNLNQKTDRGLSEPQLKPLAEEIPDWKARWELARLLGYVKRYPESIKAYRKLLEEKPDLAEAKMELALILYANNRQKEALALFEQLPRDRLEDNAKIIMGDLLAYEKEYDRSIASYRAYLDNHPGHHQVRLRLAEVLSWAKQYDASIEQYREVLKHRPDNIQARRKYALVLSWAKRHGEAIDELKKTLPRK